MLISCDLTTLMAPAPIPSPNPITVNTIVAMTAGAAATQTAVLIPPTLTPSFTPFPSQTPSITPTPTNTFVFATPTMLKFKTPVPTKKSSGGGGGGGGGGGSGGGGSNTGTWACKLTGQSPSNGATFSTSASFTANWMLKNTGSNKWVHTSVDVVNIGGTLMAAKSAYDTLSDVSTGSSTTISIPMKAPASAGTYTSNWSLRVGDTYFCPFLVTISAH